MTQAIVEAADSCANSACGAVAGQPGMTPAAAGRNAAKPTIYAITPCPLGYLLAAATVDGLRAVWLGDTAADLAAALADALPSARREHADSRLNAWTATLQAYLRGQQPDLSLPLDVAGTPFQRRVWQALQAIPYGSTRTYSQVAQAIDQPAAVRAVASACAANPVALVIPCHRVVRAGGELSGYRWGLPRKRALLALEAAQQRLPL